MPDLLHEIELLAREQERLQEKLANTILELQRVMSKTQSEAQGQNVPRSPAASGKTPDSRKHAEIGGVYESLRELQITTRWLQERAERLDERCTAVTELSAVNCARIEEILHSRTWRALTRTGGFLLRLFGR
jgi:hypothetical protein